MMKREYSCDICRDPKPKAVLHGVHFLDLRKFDLRDADSTEGVHICTQCLRQLSVQASPALARREAAELPSPPQGGEK